MVLDGFRDVAEVGDQPDPHASGFKTEAHRIDCIVRDGKALNFDITELKAGSRLEGLKLRFLVLPLNGGTGEVREVNGNAGAFGELGKAADVVGVFVRYQHGVEMDGMLAHRCQAFYELTVTQPGIHQDSSGIGSDQSGIAGTAAGENAEFNDKGPPAQAPVAGRRLCAF